MPAINYKALHDLCQLILNEKTILVQIFGIDWSRVKYHMNPLLNKWKKERCSSLNQLNLDTSTINHKPCDPIDLWWTVLNKKRKKDVPPSTNQLFQYFNHKPMLWDRFCGWWSPWDGLTVKQKPVKSNVPIYRICLNIERRGIGTSFKASQATVSGGWQALTCSTLSPLLHLGCHSRLWDCLIWCSLELIGEGPGCSPTLAKLNIGC